MSIDGSRIKNIAILQSAVYSISSKVEADIQVRFMNQFVTPQGVSRLSVQGSLDLVQRENFALGTVERQIGFGPENELANQLRSKSVWDVMMDRFNKNTTVEWRVNSKYLTTASSAAPTSDVKVNLLIDVPVSQSIRYSPSFLEKMSQLWIQYVALLIPSLYVIYFTILGGAFERKILQSRVQSEIKHSQMEASKKSQLKMKYDF